PYCVRLFCDCRHLVLHYPYIRRYPSNGPVEAQGPLRSLHVALPISRSSRPARCAGSGTPPRKVTPWSGPAAPVPVGWSTPRCDLDRKSTRLNSSHVSISYAVFCLKKKTRLIMSHHMSPIAEISA